MRPWQVLVVAAVVLNGLVVSAFIFAQSFELITPVLAGAILPVFISGGLLYWADTNKNRTAQELQKINIIGFILKIILLGIWAIFHINTGVMDKMTFIVMLLINFLAWHGVEAYYWRLFMLGNGHQKGENP